MQYNKKEIFLLSFYDSGTLCYNTHGDNMKKIIAICALLISLSGCQTSSNVEKYSSQMTDVGFDTFVSLTLYTKNEEDFHTYEKIVKDAFQHYNKLFDKYHAYDGINNIYTINQQAGIAPVKVDQKIIDLLMMSKTYSEKTNHQFDITMGPVLEIWHEYRDAGSIANEAGEESELPSLTELNEAKMCVGWDNVEINEEEQTVFLKKDCASLDVGSVAKGYATEMVAQELEAQGITAGILNAGGNVRLIGKKPDGNDWKVGIQVPDIISSMTDSLATVSLPSASSFVTSGDYQRYYMHNGEMIHHIIDPSTLFPANHFRAVTVIDPNSSAEADILSTSLFTLSYEDGMKLIDDLKAQGHIIDAIWVFDSEEPLPTEAEVMKAGKYHIIATDGIRESISIK